MRQPVTQSQAAHSFQNAGNQFRYTPLCVNGAPALCKLFRNENDMISLCDTFSSLNFIAIEAKRGKKEQIVPELNVAYCDAVHCVIDGIRPAGHSLGDLIFFSRVVPSSAVCCFVL